MAASREFASFGELRDFVDNEELSDGVVYVKRTTSKGFDDDGMFRS